MEVSLVELLPFVVFLLVVAGLLVALWRMKDVSSPEPSSESAVDKAADAVSGARATRSGARRRRGGLAGMRAAVERHGDGDAADRNEVESGEEVAEGSASSARSKGRVKKDANREARRAAREAREEAVAAQRDRMDKEDEVRAEERAREEEELRVREEEEAQHIAEAARKVKEEYHEWKGLIEIEDAGVEAEDATKDDAALLQRFVGYVKENKIVVLEELAAEYDLKTEQAIQRLTALEEEGTLTGVFDDRGKYIYVSMDEMKSVAAFIEKRGRLSIAELATESTRLLNLEAAVAPS